MKEKLTIKSLLGVSLKIFKDYISACYKMGVNPYTALVKIYPDIAFRFTCQNPGYLYGYPFENKERDKYYIYIYYDIDKDKSCITIEKDGQRKVYHPTYIEVGW